MGEPATITTMRLLTLVPTLVCANFGDIFQDVQDLVASRPGLRSIPSFIPSLPLLEGWGCWCQFDENSLKGRGSPINEIDRARQVLVHGYKCNIMDSIDEGDNDCEPWSVPYNSSTGMGGQSLLDACAFRNENGCAERNCIVEGNFVISLFTLLGNSHFVEAQYNHDNGFDTDAECGVPQPIENAGGSLTLECCGAYPVRFPYNTNNGNHNCCGQKVFNVNVMTCCDDDLVAAVC